MDMGRTKKADPQAAAALAAVLDLAQVPWLTRAGDAVAPRTGFYLRSIKTVGEMIADLPPERQAQRYRDAAVWGIPLDEPDEIHWDVSWPVRAPGANGWVSPFFGAMTLEEWIDWEASKIPPGYLPVRLDHDELGRRDHALSRLRRAVAASTQSHAERDAAIKAAMASAAGVQDIIDITGLSKARLYQIRDQKTEN